MAEPSPIKVARKPEALRQPNWKKEDREKLLDHILMYMRDPTLGYNKRGKADLEENVLPKTSPDIEENPEKSRKLEEIIYQYYRTGHPNDNKKGMYDWLKEVLEFDARPGALQIHFYAEYMKANRLEIVQKYKDAYTRI